MPALRNPLSDHRLGHATSRRGAGGAPRPWRDRGARPEWWSVGVALLLTALGFSTSVLSARVLRVYLLRDTRAARARRGRAARTAGASRCARCRTIAGRETARATSRCGGGRTRIATDDGAAIADAAGRVGRRHRRLGARRTRGGGDRAVRAAGGGGGRSARDHIDERSPVSRLRAPRFRGARLGTAAPGAPRGGGMAQLAHAAGDRGGGVAHRKRAGRHPGGRQASLDRLRAARLGAGRRGARGRGTA